jgi:trimeric autotransporter adhesin
MAAPQMMFIGDSVTAGLGVTTGWPGLLSLTNQPSYDNTTWAIPGSTITSMIASEPNRAAPGCGAYMTPAVALLFAGTNDFESPDLISGASATPASVFNMLAGEVQILKRAGCRVFVGTMLSRTGTDGGGVSYDSDKDSYDALILGGWKRIGADGVIDFAANPLLGADGANAGSYFQADHVHPIQAGQQILANEASNALNYYFGYNDQNPHVVAALPYSMSASDGTVSLAGVTDAGIVTLPDCTGQSGAVYRISNPQAAFAVTVAPSNSSQLINGLAFGSAVTVPANGTLTLRDVPNAKTVAGCHWEM